MTAITITSRNTISADWDRGSIIVDKQAGGTVNLGDVVYLDDNDQVQQAIGSSAKAGHAFGIVTGLQNQYGETSVGLNGWCSVTISGPVFGFIGAVDFVDGQMLYVSKTVAGGLDTAAPAGGVYDFIVGNAQSPHSLFVRPGQSAPASTA